MNGEAARPDPDPVELADPLGRPLVVLSNKARTSLLSSSSMDSNDICLFAIIAVAADSLHLEIC